MTDSNLCVIHFGCETRDAPVTYFSVASFGKFLNSRSSWLLLDGIQREVAEKSIQFISRDAEADKIDFRKFSYHRGCYSRFTNTTDIKRAQVRCQKKCVVESGNIEVDDTLQPINKKVLRSMVANTSVKPRSFHVTRPVCIICKSENSYITESKSRKRTLDKLVSAETLDGGKLREAATRKADESILIEIANKDAVALEVKYHKRCYEKYTSFLRCRQKSGDQYEPKYTKSFDVFCEDFVSRRIIEEEDIFYMSRIKKEFTKTVSIVENTDASHYRTFRLKERLQKRFPQLVFYTPTVRNKSEIVYAEYANQGRIAESFLDEEVESSEDEDDFDPIEVEMPRASYGKTTATLKEIYMVALTFRNIMRGHTTAWYTNWPPRASDINGESVRKLVSPLLFNFVVWLLGFSDEPEEADYIELDEKTTATIFSLCQDLVYVASKGKIQTPKSLALATAVRQISGCSELIKILNGFGHCVSLSATMSYDSAIAQATIETSTIIPREFVAKEYVNLVYDNIDFGEEISKQTHVTNGIITQKISVQKQTHLANQKLPVIKKSQRTVAVSSADIMPYSIGTKKTPKFHTIELDSESLEFAVENNSSRVARKLDLAYILIKHSCAQNAEVMVPGWTGFNTMLCKEIPTVSRVGYLPVINASPTEYSTIFAVLKRCTEIADKLELKYAVLVFDEAVYAKVQQIRWKEAVFRDRFIVRLGEFHATMTYLATMSKIFEDGGLKDVFIESGIVSEGSIKGVLTGKHYNRSVSCHKIMYEALQRLRFQAFLDYVGEDERMILFIEKLSRSFQEDTFQMSEIEGAEMQQILDSYELFISESSSKSRTFAFWSIYIQMAGILLMFIRATRQVDWNLHVKTFRAMLPWFFICDRVNYARYGSAYILEMTALEKTHPGILQELSTNFAVQRQGNHGFFAVACDQTIEQTVNRDSKTKGGLIGFSMNRSTVQRWLLSQSERASVTRKCKQMAGMESKPRTRKDLDATKCKRHEKSVNDVMNTILSMINPFELIEQEELVGLASGIMLENCVADVLLSAEKMGEQQFVAFSKNNLLCDDPDIFTKLKRNKIQTFSTTKKVLVKDKDGKKNNIVMNRNLFARLLVIAKSRKIDLKELLTYSLGPYPLALATTTGALVKTAKSQLVAILEDDAGDLDADARGFDNNAIIVDAMAVIQSLTRCGRWKTFGELADAILEKLVNLARQWNCTRLDFVSDRYPVLSIKNTERERRANQGVQRVHIFGEHQNVPKQWKKYLSCGENKESLLVFLFEHWRSYISRAFGGISAMYVTAKEKCYIISPAVSENDLVTCEEVPMLQSNHEEADTRLLLHAKHAASTHSKIIINSPDTDVYILSIAMQHAIVNELFFMTGTVKRFRCVRVSTIANNLGEETFKCLPGFHAYTGCDTTSSFHGKGKKTAWKVFKKYPEFARCFVNLGRNFPPGEELVEDLNKFTCLLYGDETSTTVDNCRHAMFSAGKCSDDVLPPTCDSLLQHILRANYQASLWYQCLNAEIVVPPPVGNGWTLTNAELQVVWMTRPPAPQSLMEYIDCRCKTGCKSLRCSCKKAGLKCTDLCKCSDCQNGNDDEELSDDTEEEVVDSDSDWDNDNDDEF